DPIYVVFAVSEQEMLRWQEMIAAGEVRIPADGKFHLAMELIDGSPYPRQGVLNFVSVQVDTNTGSAVARGEFPNPDDTLRPGQFVRVTSLGIEQPNVIIVPQRAVMQSPAGATVYVAAPDDKAELRTV